MKILHSSGVRASISGKLITIFAREFDVDTKSEELCNLKLLKVEKVFRERERENFQSERNSLFRRKSFPFVPFLG